MTLQVPPRNSSRGRHNRNKTGDSLQDRHSAGEESERSKKFNFPKLKVSPTIGISTEWMPYR